MAQALVLQLLWPWNNYAAETYWGSASGETVLWWAPSGYLHYKLPFHWSHAALAICWLPLILRNTVYWISEIMKTLDSVVLLPTHLGFIRISAISECHKMVCLTMSDFREEIFDSERLPESERWLRRWAYRRRQCLFSLEVNAFADTVSRGHRAVRCCWPNPIHLRDVNWI